MGREEDGGADRAGKGDAARHQAADREPVEEGVVRHAGQRPGANRIGARQGTGRKEGASDGFLRPDGDPGPEGGHRP